VMILLARDRGVEAGVVDGWIGVWADKQSPEEWAGADWAREIAKLGAIGVRLSRWITMHGFALNLTVDLSAFDWIVPCGIREHGVTSVEALTGRVYPVREVALASAGAFRQALDLDVEAVEDRSADDLGTVLE